jgi:peroxidase
VFDLNLIKISSF